MSAAIAGAATTAPSAIAESESFFIVGHPFVGFPGPVFYPQIPPGVRGIWVTLGINWLAPLSFYRLWNFPAAVPSIPSRARFARKSPGLSRQGLSFQIAAGSVGRHHRAAPAELVAQPADEGVDVARPRIERVEAGAAADLVALALEAVVVGLEAGDPIRREAVFDAGAEGNAVVPVAVGAGAHRGDGVRDGELRVRASPARLRVEQPVVERPAQPADDGGNAVDPVGVEVVELTERAQIVALDVGARIGAFDADDQPCDLIVAAELAAANDTRRGLRKSLPRDEIAERGGVHGVGIFGPGIAAADMAADIAAGPGKHRQWRRRLRSAPTSQ